MYRNKLSKGELKKRPHDQHVRKGATRESLIDLEMIAISSPLGFCLFKKFNVCTVPYSWIIINYPST